MTLAFDKVTVWGREGYLLTHHAQLKAGIWTLRFFSLLGTSSFSFSFSTFSCRVPYAPTFLRAPPVAASVDTAPLPWTPPFPVDVAALAGAPVVPFRRRPYSHVHVTVPRSVGDPAPVDGAIARRSRALRDAILSVPAARADGALLVDGTGLLPRGAYRRAEDDRTGLQCELREGPRRGVPDAFRPLARDAPYADCDDAGNFALLQAIFNQLRAAWVTSARDIRIEKDRRRRCSTDSAQGL